MREIIGGLQMLMSHGFSGYLIIFTGLLCAIISLERIYFLYFVSSYESAAALTKIRKAIAGRNYSQALQICNEQDRNPELKTVRDGLLAVENGREAMSSALSAAILGVSRACENRLSFLSLIASSATLLGLFGTILGLIKTFAAIAGTDPAEKARLLGSGISEAMYSTAAGVIIGVFAMAIHTVCVAKTDSIIAKVQNVALNLVKWIEESERVQKA